MYAANDVQNELVSRHGAKLRFVLDRLNKSGFKFKVGDLKFERFEGKEDQVSVNAGAPDLSSAAGWALDGIREWAGATSEGQFAEITREWATLGEGKDDAPSSIGTTIDWLYLFSANASDHASGIMYRVKDPERTDLFNLFCWVFANKWVPTSMAPAKAAVNIKHNFTLNRRFWDVLGPQEDQTHHFAAYFWWGAAFGANRLLLNHALARSGDYDLERDKPINPGDVELGRLAAKWGWQMARAPGYLGKKVEASLR